MNASQQSPGSGPAPVDDAGGAALVAALETASAAIWCLAGTALEPVWANARARALGTGPHDLVSVAGRRVTELAGSVARTGRAETVHGDPDPAGQVASVVLQPLEVRGQPGVLVVVEADRTDSAQAVAAVAEEDVVDQVQHSLLPPALPLLPDVRLSGSYHRASSVHAAGGDWYDAVPLGRGRLALVVGDAVGHGVPAAGAMSRLRGAMRSLALRDPSPAAVVAALDAFAGQMEDVEGASVFYGVLEAATGRLTYAAAGHPAPLLVRADGSAEFLPLAPRPPLGSLPGAPTVAATAQLPQGATLVLFSDGAVAAAGWLSAEGLDRLARVSQAALTAPGALAGDVPGELAAAIVEGLADTAERPDDIAVLVAHRRAVTTEPLALDLPAVPVSLPTVRRRLGAWLAGLGMGEQDRVGVMVAVGEAAANAAEHAYRGVQPGRMQVTAAVDVDGQLTVIVRDQGRWRPPDRDPGDRGRGLLIMRQLVDGVVLQGEHGTTVTLNMRLRRSPDDDADRPGGTSAADVAVDRSGECPVVRATGAVDMLGAEQMRIRLLEASHGGTGRVELDLTAVTLFSSAAVRVVLAVARIAGDEGWRLVVHAPEGGVTRHVLEISGLGGLVELR
ncbi:SpoIIE family protein phosphatase [Geodermatophilus poikilotrophus]|uniref:Anti-anti-sigma factor n=1 Tax=Geodermatophilus poikilotrophus TaxID=1333667 RepID=A0A1H9ZVF2_9ACTN|nr:SpoIIE family protein phosphatase [Geodermatophilus poikilotrophus]SES85750.1 anti-anti-sigma factor [Geodermatophilus poikilotrophus]